MAVSLAPGNRVLRDAVKEARFWNSMQQGSAALKGKPWGRRMERLQEGLLRATERSKRHAGLRRSTDGERRTTLPQCPCWSAWSNPIRPLARNWMDSVVLQSTTHRPQVASDTIAKVPSVVAVKLTSSPEYKILVAEIKDVGQTQEARKALNQAPPRGTWWKRVLIYRLYVQMSLDRLYSPFGESDKAAKIYRSALEREPTNRKPGKDFFSLAIKTTKLRMLCTSFKGFQRLSTSQRRLAPHSCAPNLAALETNVGNFSSAEALSNRSNRYRDFERRSGQLFNVTFTRRSFWLEKSRVRNSV